MTVEVRQQLFDAIMRADRDGAARLFLQWAQEHGFELAVHEILEPTLADIGARWKTGGNISLAHGYLAAKVAEDVLAQASADASQEATRQCPGVVVIANIEDDFHALGRRMVSVSLRTAGWDVHDLGNDVPAEVMVDTANEVGAKVIGASAMMHTTAINIQKVRREIDRRNLTGRIQLAVGGAIFLLRPSLVAEVGGDGTARNSLEAPALMKELLRRATVVEASA